MVELTETCSEKDWHDFLSTCENATIYHTPEWKKILESTFSYTPKYLFARDECDNLVGILPLFMVSSRLTGNRLSCLPFSHECSPLGEDTTIQALLTQACHLADATLPRPHLEIRSPVQSPVFCSCNLFSTFLIELPKTLDEIWKSLKRDVQRGVLKAKNAGVTVSMSNNAQKIDEFYELYCINRKQIGVPSHPKTFFTSLFMKAPNNTILYRADYQGEMVAGGIMLRFKDRIIYGYGSSNPTFQSIYPTNAFLWKSIEDAFLNSCRLFDFGRVSYDNSGLINFKQRWGTKEKKMVYSYYPHNFQSLLMNRNGHLHRFGKRIIQHLPISVYKSMNNHLTGGFG